MSDIRTQLKNIIRESVKQCLIELHWKTWDAAPKKAKGQFGHNADKYEGFDDGDGFAKMDNGIYRGGEIGSRKDKKHQTFGRSIDSDGNYSHFEQNGMSTASQTNQPKFHSRSVARKFANGANEINRMKNAEYIKGQGWQPDPNYNDIDWHEFWDSHQ